MAVIVHVAVMLLALTTTTTTTTTIQVRIGDCGFNKQNTICIVEKAQKQQVEQGSTVSFNWAIALPEAFGQDLEVSPKNISVNNGQRIIIQGTNVSSYLKNWNNWHVEHRFMPKDGYVLFNLTVSVVDATYSDDIELHLELHYGNLIFQTGHVYINVQSAGDGPSTPTPSLSIVTDAPTTTTASMTPESESDTTTPAPAPECHSNSEQSEPGPSNSVILGTMIFGFVVLMVLIKWTWICNQVETFYSFLPCADGSSSSTADLAVTYINPERPTGVSGTRTNQEAQPSTGTTMSNTQNPHSTNISDPGNGQTQSDINCIVRIEQEEIVSPEAQMSSSNQETMAAANTGDGNQSPAHDRYQPGTAKFDDPQTPHEETKTGNPNSPNRASAVSDQREEHIENEEDMADLFGTGRPEISHAPTSLLVQPEDQEQESVNSPLLEDKDRHAPP